MVLYPEAISWIVNSACNLTCPHCYVEAGPHRRETNLTSTLIGAMCESMASIRPRGIIVSGGEPLLEPMLPPILASARRTAREVLWLCSNGRLLSSERAQQLADAGVNGVTLSLDHPSPAENDRQRGRGTFRRVLEAAGHVRRHGMTVLLEMTVTRASLNAVEAFVDLAATHGIERVTFKRFRPIGRGRENMNELSVTPEENRTVLERIAALADIHADTLHIAVHDPLYAEVAKTWCHERGVDVHRVLRSRTTGCKAGTFWVGVDRSGNVAMCPLLLGSGTEIGNLLDRPLQRILDESPLVGELAARRAQSLGGANAAELAVSCLAHAYWATGSLFGADPMAASS